MLNIIIPAAGMASRMKPLSNGVSKSMLAVNGKPIISYILDYLLELEVAQIVIVQNEIGDIENFVKHIYPKQYKDRKITFTKQENRLGPLHAIQLGAECLREQHPTLIWLGDTICLEEELDFTSSFVLTATVAQKWRWCLIDEENVLYDKPDGPVETDKALIGVYYFNSGQKFDQSLTEGMEKPTHKGEYQISAMLQSSIDRGDRFVVKNTSEWYDCGELSTFYESKARLLTRATRSFNQISVDTFLGLVTKTGKNPETVDKIELEKNWFTSLNEKQSLFIPKVLNSEPGSLKMSLESGTALSDMWLYEKIRTDEWSNIISKILKIQHEVFYTEEENFSLEAAREECMEMYFNKNMKRLFEHCRDYPRFEYVTRWLGETAMRLAANPRWSSTIHGDLHLGNILFDPNNGNIKYVDPRGKFGNRVGPAGDSRYDMAKIMQDLWVGYVMILGDRYHYEDGKVVIEYAPDHREILSSFDRQLHEHGYIAREISELAIILVLTCIPFHTENPKRQRAFWDRCLYLIDLNELRDKWN